MKKKIVGRRGFTLVEIMIVVSIIGLVAAIAIPNFLKARARSQSTVCINNLRQISSATQQWALENKKTIGTAVSAQDIQPYLRNNAVPACPLGGAYTLNVVGTSPTCSIPGHVLPQE